MNESFNVACIQNCAGDDLAANLAEAETLTRAAVEDGAEFVCLPECFPLIARDNESMLRAATDESKDAALRSFRALAKELETWMLLGSIMIRHSADKVYNRSFVIDPTGEIVARYNKIHLFDVNLRGGESYLESSYAAPGDSAVVYDLPWGRLGMSVCYDLRFAQLYRALAHAGALFLTIPAAFTKTTGEAHWHTLVRARAIETASFVFAPCQYGTRHWGRATFGHSLIVDPWGQVLADGGEGPGFVMARIDPALVDENRQRIPALEHDREFRLPETDTPQRGTGTAG